MKAGKRFPFVAAAMVAGFWALPAAAARKLTVIPCPEPKTRFDYTEIDRSLKEPEYGSAKQAYRYFACGPEGKEIVAVVADESQGTGKGVDTFYIDLTVGDTIDIALFSIDLHNPFLEVYGPDSSYVAENNDYRDLSALIPRFGAPMTGTYWIVARSAQDETGSYLLKVRSSGPVVNTEPF